MSHTTTPWTYRKATQHFYIEGTNRSSGRRIATVPYVANGTTGWTSEANAAHIIHCVNNHDQLVAALQKISANAAESTEWIRRVANQALAATEKGA